MTNNQTEIAVTIEDETWLDDLPAAEDLCRRSVEAALRGAGMDYSGPLEVSVLLTDDGAIQDLNARYRGKDRPTNVLSFPSGDPRLSPDMEVARVGAPDAGMPLLLGDVAVAHGTTAREASAAGKPVADHLSHLIVHGVLHLLGYDHEDDSDAEAMERLEVSILSGLGISDPYQTLTNS
jgi:probable rRNA maturation factor